MSGRYAALRAPLLFDPGERWEYGIGLDGAGRLVEIVSGRQLGGRALDGVRVLTPETVALMGQNDIGDIEVPAFKSDDATLAQSGEQFPGQIKR